MTLTDALAAALHERRIPPCQPSFGTGGWECSPKAHELDAAAILATLPPDWILVRTKAGRIDREAVAGISKALANAVEREWTAEVEITRLRAALERSRTALSRIARVARDYSSEERWGVYPLGLFQMIVDECAATIYEPVGSGSGWIEPRGALPMTREDMDDLYGGIAPPGRPVYEPDGTVTEPRRIETAGAVEEELG